MSRLILFSGGVESTALLTRANRFDHILTVVDESSEEMMTTFRKDSVEAILKHFNLRGHYMTISSSKKFEPKNNSVTGFLPVFTSELNKMVLFLLKYER